jgi:hypothetical protein
VSCWAVHGECLAITLVVVTLDKWELDLRIMELLDVVTACLGSDDLFDLDDLFRARRGNCKH